MAAIAYGGFRYPVTTETLRAVVNRIQSFEFTTGADFIEISTTDGRHVLLRVGYGLPIAFESAGDGE